MNRITPIGTFFMGFISLWINGCVAPSATEPWKAAVQKEIAAIGSQNWIIIAEPAYPTPSNAGITSIVLEQSTPEVIAEVFHTIENLGHVTPRVFITRESRKLTEDYAPGITRYREQLSKALDGRQTRTLPSEALELSINEASDKYKILVLKTQTALPYTSVFLELESGYWDGESETALRNQTQ